MKYILLAITMISATSFAQRGNIGGGGRGFCRVITSDWSNVAQVTCGIGEYALNGGGECNVIKGKHAQLIQSLPLTDSRGLSTGWQTDCHYADNSAGAQARAVATCCPL